MVAMLDALDALMQIETGGAETAPKWAAETTTTTTTGTGRRATAERKRAKNADA
jgi:hypothetical protein